MVGPGGVHDAREGVYISKIAVGGAAEACKAMQVGLRILSIDGKDTRKATKKETAAIFKECGNAVSIGVVRDGGEIQYNKDKAASRGAAPPAPPPAAVGSAGGEPAPVGASGAGTDNSLEMARAKAAKEMEAMMSAMGMGGGGGGGDDSNASASAATATSRGAAPPPPAPTPAPAPAPAPASGPDKYTNMKRLGLIKECKTLGIAGSLSAADKKNEDVLRLKLRENAAASATGGVASRGPAPPPPAATPAPAPAPTGPDKYTGMKRLALIKECKVLGLTAALSASDKKDEDILRAKLRAASSESRGPAPPPPAAAATAAAAASGSRPAAAAVTLDVPAPSANRYDDAGKFALRGVYKARALGAAPKDVGAQRAALAAANVALAAKVGNALAAGILNYEHSTKNWGGSVASVTKLCEQRGVSIPAAVKTSWEGIAKILAENCEIPLGVEFGDMDAGVSYKDESVESLVKICGSVGLFVPNSVSTPWFELVKLLVALDASMKAKYAGQDNAQARLYADKVRLKSMLWEEQVVQVSEGLAELVKHRKSECPSLEPPVAKSAAELVALSTAASRMIAGNGDAMQFYEAMELKTLQTRCIHRGVKRSPEEIDADALALKRIGEGGQNPCDLCKRRLAGGAGTGKCWPWCQNPDGPDTDAQARAKMKAVRGLVHLEETIKNAFGPSEFAKLGSAWQGMGGRELSMEASKCKPKFNADALDGSQLVERLIFEANLMKFMKVKVMAKRREMAYELELDKSLKMALALEKGEDTPKMWHVFTRWEGAHDEKDKGVTPEAEVPPVDASVGRVLGYDALVKQVAFAKPLQHNASRKSHARRPQNFEGHACDGPCCDLHFSGAFDPSKCIKRKSRPTKLKFAANVESDSLPKQGFAVPFLATKDVGEVSKPGYLSFSAGQQIFVWNESGDPDADLGEVGADGEYWLFGWVGHGSEKPLYAEDAGFGEGVKGFKEGIFPGSAVTRPPNA